MKKLLVIDPLIKVKKIDLLEPPVIIRINKIICEDTTEKFAEDFNHAHETGQPVIPIVIDSYGGSVYTLLEMISIIQSTKLPVATIVQSKAMSAAAVLFGFGTDNYRYMAENATLMLHDISSFSFGKVEEIKANAKEIKRLQKLVFNNLAKHLKKKEDYFINILHEKGHAEWYLNAKNAKKHNLCNHIAIPELVTEIKVSHTFK